MGRRAAVLLLLVGALSGPVGCVYYNGMYNANRLAGSARKAEREGRTLEASSLWGQVATKAESVIVRHPTSKYAREAALLRGVALARLGQCEQALGPLGATSGTNTKSELREEALLAAGRCHLALENWSAAEAAFSQLVNSKNAARRQEARFQQARLLRQSGQYSAALVALSRLHDPRTRSERVLALAGAGYPSQALALTDSLIAQGDTAQQWDSVLNFLAQRDPAAASRLVDRLKGLPSRRVQLQASMLLEDGYRLAGIDTARAAQRFREVVGMGATSDLTGRAALALVQLDVSGADDPSDLKPARDSLARLAPRFRMVSQEIERYQRAVDEVHTAAAAAVAPDTGRGDLRLFLAAESARDVLTARQLAGSLFRRIPEQWPSSPYAPKAVLAAQQLDPTWIDSARVLLELYYGDSPYLAAVRGDMTPEYRQLEDSLGAFAASLAVSRPATQRRRPLTPPGNRRPQPEAGGSRVPEP
jgi:tetratricopeptide (TPR) repeat protein